MKHLSVAAFIALAVVALGATRASADAAMNFGSPPSGEIPILYNDHHVYARPDVLRRDRVLAAIVENGTLMVPLRSMFEQMDAVVSYDASTQSVTAKGGHGATVQVTLGKNEAVINGETRPLDQPPIMYQGHLLVPVRVMSEALGAYVEWVSSRRLVVVRFVPPTPAPTLAPTAPPTPTPAPVIPPTYHAFIQAALVSDRNYNEFAAGDYCLRDSWQGAAAVLFDPFAVKLDYRSVGYVTAHNADDTFGNQLTSYFTPEGTVAVVPRFKARQATLDARLEYKVLNPHIYIGVGYISATNNYAVPGYSTYHGAGFGVEKLPDFPQQLTWFASLFFYPDTKGTYTEHDPANPNFGGSFEQHYSIVKYDVGGAYLLGHSPVYIYAGFSGDQYKAKQFAPVDQTHAGPYLGLGVKF